MVKRRILVLGDSHIHAIKHALRILDDVATRYDVTVLRMKIDKNGTTIGDVLLDEAHELARSLAPDDLLVTALRGNNYNKIGMLQHPQPFDVMMPGESAPDATMEVELIPFHSLKAHFFSAVQCGYGKQLIRLADASRAPTVCLEPPAAKEDSGHILKNAGKYFTTRGIADVGITPAPLRLKLWQLQQQAVAEFCAANDVTYLPNPPGTRDEAGYLKPEFYGNDATHANSKFGALVWRELERLFDRAACEPLAR